MRSPDSERQWGRWGGREHLQQQDIGREKVSPDLRGLNGDTRATSRSNTTTAHHHYATASRCTVRGRPSRPADAACVSMNGPQDPHQQYSQHHQMRQPQSDGTCRSVAYHGRPVPEAPGMGMRRGGMHSPPGAIWGVPASTSKRDARRERRAGPWTAPRSKWFHGGGPQNTNSQQQQPSSSRDSIKGTAVAATAVLQCVA